MSPVEALVAELRAALGSLTVLRRMAVGVPRHALAGGLAFYPLVGLAIGALAAAGAAASGTVAPSLAGFAGIAILLGASGVRPLFGVAAATDALLRPGDVTGVRSRLRGTPGVLGVVAAAMALAGKTWAAVILPAPARTTALALAPMLGAWAIVVQCYGGAPTHARGPAASLLGRARFREFGAASVCALGTTLAMADAVGLVMLLVAASTTVGLRLYAHRRLGGLTGRLLAATRELVETAVLVTLGLLAQLNR